MILSKGDALEVSHVLPSRRGSRRGPAAKTGGSGTTLQDAERVHILKVLEQCGWRVGGQNGAADRLGLKRSTLQSRMKKLRIRRPTSKSG